MNISIKANPQIKTIKFEAKPMWETAIHIKNYSGELSNDAKRKENYGKVKEILDRYARSVIEEATVMLVAENMEPTYRNIRELYMETGVNRNKDVIKKYEKAVSDFKKHIADVIGKVGTARQLTKAQGSLFADKTSCILNDKGTFKLTEEEKELIRMYHGFTGYFSKYFDSLSKTILCGTEHGSIANRIVENMVIYFKNEAVIREIEESHPSLYAMMNEKLSKMNITQCMSQTGVDSYNFLLGNTTNSGLNNIVNEYRKKSRVRIPNLKGLNKIPLCTEKKQIVVESIQSKEELARTIMDSLPCVEEVLTFATRCMRTEFTDELMESTYIRESYLASISMGVYGKWDILKKALSMYYASKDMANKNSFSLYDLEYAVKHCEAIPRCSVVNFFKERLEEAVKAKRDIAAIKTICRNPNILADKKTIKEFYENILKVRQAVRIFDFGKVENTFMEDMVSMQDKMWQINTVYVLVRNFCTRSPIKKDSYPITFDKSSCLSSFDYDMLKDGMSISSILRKDGMYYLLMLNPGYSTKLPKSANTKDGAYEQLVYKQLPGLNKQLPRIFMTDKYAPSEEIRNIKEQKLYTKEAGDRDACVKWIQFCIDSFKKNEDWKKYYNPVFRKAQDYASANEFYTELEKYTIYMDFSERIDEEYLRRAVAAGEVFLFQIYSRDFSPYHTGKDTPYTQLFKEMFSDENLNRINNSLDTAIKLASGGSELLFRKASIPYKETHPANVPIKSKNPLNPKKESVFDYSICKDRRFMFDKFTISFAVQVNFRAEEVSKYELSKAVNKIVMEQKPNILTVRAGERHLLYYMVTDAEGNVLEQDSMNLIKSKSKDFEVCTDYKELLERRGKEIAEAKERWGYSLDIKTIKAGYMTQAIHKIVELQKKYNSVIFVEDYSGSFVQGRMKNMKVVYQQFQKSLLQKLSCLVSDNHGYKEVMKLAEPVSSMEDLKGQSGIVYFINPSYTENMDPETGFVNQYNEFFYYENMKKAENTLQKISDISYNEDAQEFEIVLSEKEFGVSADDKEWILHTKGIRSLYKDKKYSQYDATKELGELCQAYGVADLSDMKKASLNKSFYEKLFEIITVLLRMNYYDVEVEEEYTLSPVRNKKGSCFDTRNHADLKHTTAVKTYLLTQKGIRDLQRISKETLLIARDEKGEHKEAWIAYMQTSVC